MKVLVTGGAGFLGSHLCRTLVEQGHHVTVLDDLSSGTRENLADLMGLPGFRFIPHDVVHAYDAGVNHLDRIYNLACPASPVQYQKDPVQTILTAFLGAHNALELATLTGARVLQASTSEVYGDPEVHPQPESYFGAVNPVGIRSNYDEGKRAAETLCSDYHREGRCDVRIARIFNTYGPHLRADDGRVVSNFICQAQRHKPITIYGDGGQTRSLCYVDDLIGGLISLMEAPDPGGPVNLGNPEELTILEIAGRILNRIDGPGIVFEPLPKDDPKRRCPDITKAKALLGFQPKTTFAEGLGPTIEWFQSQLRTAP